MSLLVFDHVTKRARYGRSEQTVVGDVCLDLAVGELVAVRGRRGSGRTTLLQLACGMLAPDEGTVRFAGRDLATGAALGREIAWAEPRFDPTLGRTIADQVAYPLLTVGPRTRAKGATATMLDHMGIADLSELRPGDCQHHELVVASIARAMMLAPRLLLLDEPVTGLNVTLAERIMDLLRAVALNGTAVLLSVEEAQLGVDRTLMLSHGRLRGETSPVAADVVPLRGIS